MLKIVTSWRPQRSYEFSEQMSNLERCRARVACFRELARTSRNPLSDLSWVLNESTTSEDRLDSGEIAELRRLKAIVALEASTMKKRTFKESVLQVAVPKLGVGQVRMAKGDTAKVSSLKAHCDKIPTLKAHPRALQKIALRPSQHKKCQKHGKASILWVHTLKLFDQSRLLRIAHASSHEPKNRRVLQINTAQTVPNLAHSLAQTAEIGASCEYVCNQIVGEAYPASPDCSSKQRELEKAEQNVSFRSLVDAVSEDEPSIFRLFAEVSG